MMMTATIKERGDCLHIPFHHEKQKQTASQSKPLVANATELKVAFVTNLQANKPDLLKCQVEKRLKQGGHNVLWTPPYCAELQPIELFGAAGKNHATLMYFFTRTMKETVSRVREGKYGNEDTYPVGDQYRKAPVKVDQGTNTTLQSVISQVEKITFYGLV
jgi:hypothetical protein